MNFPNLKQGKIALLLCDRKTGHVLRQNGSDLFLSGEKEPHVIEDSIENARKIANGLLLINPDREILIYDHDGGLIEMIKP